MEKLIELLNEREKTVNWVQHPWWCKEHLEYQCHWPRVINKRFWFIKWLVENDKIDLEKLRDLDITDNFNYEYFNKNKSDFLISLLSISDTPIEDLISYLK